MTLELLHILILISVKKTLQKIWFKMKISQFNGFDVLIFNHPNFTPAKYPAFFAYWLKNSALFDNVPFLHIELF